MPFHPIVDSSRRRGFPKKSLINDTSQSMIPDSPRRFGTKMAAVRNESIGGEGDDGTGF
jgi:hypothetical protein